MDHADHELFCWRQIRVISEPITFRQLLSPELCAYVESPELLDHKVATFEYVPCTQLYSIGDEEGDIYLLVCIDTNLIDEFGYDYENKDITVKFCDRRRLIHTETVVNGDWQNMEERDTPIDVSVYDTISRVNQEHLDSLRMECGNKIVNKDGEV